MVKNWQRRKNPVLHGFAILNPVAQTDYFTSDPFRQLKLRSSKRIELQASE
jgi:hypothetical protein